MGTEISKRYSGYKSQPKVFKLLYFFPNGPHETTLEFLKNFQIEISFSLTYGIQWEGKF